MNVAAIKARITEVDNVLALLDEIEQQARSRGLAEVVAEVSGLRARR